MTQAMCTSFKVELFQAVHNFKASGGNQFKCALATSSASLNAGTSNYSELGANEVTSSGYTAGGFPLVNVDSSAAGVVAMQSFSTNPSWFGVSFTTSQALVYNASAGNKAVAVIDFGGSQTVVLGTFIINLPPVTATTAFLRLV